MHQMEMEMKKIKSELQKTEQQRNSLADAVESHEVLSWYALAFPCSRFEIFFVKRTLCISLCFWNFFSFAYSFHILLLWSFFFDMIVFPLFLRVLQFSSFPNGYLHIQTVNTFNTFLFHHSNSFFFLLQETIASLHNKAEGSTQALLQRLKNAEDALQKSKNDAEEKIKEKDEEICERERLLQEASSQVSRRFCELFNANNKYLARTSSFPTKLSTTRKRWKVWRYVCLF